jgi:thioredoxin reductase (NADPH)
MKDKIWDVVIIGSGPAGLTAGIYAVRGAATTVILGGETWGGQLMLTSVVDNYPGFSDGIIGPSLMENMKKQALRFGAEFIPKNVTEVDFSKIPFKLATSDSVFLAKTVIIATGAETKWLGVPGEKEFIGRGISSCAPCDAPFFKEKDVLVVGGGDSAMEEALVLAKFASKVTLIHRRSEFKASKAMQEKVFANKKINVIWNTEILEVIGSTKFEGLKVKNITSSEVSEIKADGMFVAIGHTPSSEIFKGKIELDEKGYIKVHSGTKTNIPGVFVSGDVHDFTYKQAVTAAGFGCQAALDTLNYLVDKN